MTIEAAAALRLWVAAVLRAVLDVRGSNARLADDARAWLRGPQVRNVLELLDFDPDRAIAALLADPRHPAPGQITNCASPEAIARALERKRAPIRERARRARARAEDTEKS